MARLPHRAVYHPHKTAYLRDAQAPDDVRGHRQIDGCRPERDRERAREREVKPEADEEKLVAAPPPFVAQFIIIYNLDAFIQPGCLPVKFRTCAFS